MHRLHEFKGDLVLNQAENEHKNVKFEDYKYQSLVNPVPENWRWQFKKGHGNLMNTTIGTVKVLDGWGQCVKQRRFTSRYERNHVVNLYQKLYPSKKMHYISVEFD